MKTKVSLKYFVIDCSRLTQRLNLTVLIENCLKLAVKDSIEKFNLINFMNSLAVLCPRLQPQPNSLVFSQSFCYLSIRN